AVLCGAGFLAVVDQRFPELDILTRQPALGRWFVVTIALWCVFVLQDAALTGLRRAGWVLAENTVFGMAKIALLFVPAVAGSGQGIFLAWTVPLIPLVVAVNLAMFWLPVRAHAAAGAGEPIRVSRVARFAAGDYTAALVSTGLISVLPILVLATAGAEAAAFFSLAWSIAYALFLVSRSMATSLLVESAFEPTRLGEYSFRVAKQTARLLVPTVLAVVVAAPLVLRLFGARYAAEGTTLLRLLALAALPSIITTVYAAVERARGRMATLVWTTLVLNLGALSLSTLLLARYGITGIGMAWLATQSVAAGLLLAFRLGHLWLAEVDPRTVSRLVAVVAPFRFWIRRRQQREDIAGWRVDQVLPTVGDVTVATMAPSAVLKLARTSRGAMALGHELDVIGALAADPGLAGWRSLLPEVLTAGENRGHRFVVARRLPGTDGRIVLGDPLTRPPALAAALDAIATLHERTAVDVFVDDARLERWVERPLALVRVQASPPGLQQVQTALHRALAGRTVTVSWIHGDLAPGNLLFAADGRRVDGIVDWELGAPQRLPGIDVVHLLVTTRMLVEHRELGDVVSQLLARPPDNGPLADRALVLLTWLHHVAGILGKTDRYTSHSLWVARNVDRVLRGVDATSRAVAHR
ncbi:MAG: phosphotransferase, partial [Acidimicrobiales bacterium]